jgi:hypothetical protein
MNELKLTKKQIIDLADPFHTISLGSYSFNVAGFADALLKEMHARPDDDDHCGACDDTGEGQAPDSVCPICNNPSKRNYRVEP